MCYDPRVIYFARRLDTSEIKIGTTEHLDRRMRELRSEAGPVEVLATMPGDRNEEQRLHQRFALFSTRGEWFVSSTSLLRYVQSLTMATNVNASR